MIDVYYCGRWEAADFVEQEPWVAISITDPGSKPATLRTSQRKDVLRLSFYDLDQRLPGYDVLFCQSMAESVVDFVQKWAPKVKTVLVHCEAGISRSAAVAAFIEKVFLSGDDAKYFRRAYPNMLVYRMLSEEWQRRKLLEVRCANTVRPR